MKSLRGHVSVLYNNFENLQAVLDKQEQYSWRNCLLTHGISENKDEDIDEMVIKILKPDTNIDMKTEQIYRPHRISFKEDGSNRKSRPIRP